MTEKLDKSKWTVIENIDLEKMITNINNKLNIIDLKINNINKRLDKIDQLERSYIKDNYSVYHSILNTGIYKLNNQYLNDISDEID